MDGVITSFLSNIDDSGREFVSTIYEQLGGSMDNIFRLMLIIYVIWWGYNVVGGRESVAPIEAAYRLGRAILIYWFITSWDTFSETIYELVQSIPEEVGKAVMSGVAEISGGGGPTDPTAIGQIFDQLYEDTQRIIDQIYTGSMMDIFGAILALVVLIVVAIFTAIAVAAIMAAKIMLWLALALAPIWIILALYRWSTRFWDGFITLTSNLIIQQILIYGFIGFYSSLISRALNMAVNSGGGGDITGKLSYVLPLIFAMLVGVYVLMQIPMIAAILSGSAPVGATGAFGAMSRSLRNVGRSAATTGRGVRSGWRGATGFMRQSTQGRQQLSERSSRQEAARSLIAANARKNAAPLS